LVLGIDDTIERRRGCNIAAQGVSRDPVRSSKECVVNTNGVRWMFLMLLTPIPWACRVWALPFVTVLAPSERNQRQKTITDWAWQMILHISRWMPGRRLIVVADGTSAVLDVLLNVSHLPSVCTVTRACPIRPRCVKQENEADRPSLTPQRCGRNRPWHGMEEPRERWRTALWDHFHPPGCDPLGSHSRSKEPRRTPGSALHRSTGRGGPDGGVVCPALDSGRHLS